MKASLIYFSSTGNTAWCALTFKKELELQSVGTKIYEVINDRPSIDLDADLLGVFYPLWGTELPGPMHDWLKEINRVSTGKIFFIGNYANGGGDTGINVMKMMDNRNTVYADYLRMPLNCGIPFSFFGYRFPFIQTMNTGQEEIPHFTKKSKVKIQKMAQDILQHRHSYKGYGIISRWLSNRQRAENSKYYALSKDIYVNESLCNQCGMCYKWCPVENIGWQKTQSPQFHDKCLMCLKCCNLCPKETIQITAKSTGTSRFIRYKEPDTEIKPAAYR